MARSNKLLVTMHPSTSPIRCNQRKKRKKSFASSKKLLTSIKEKGPLGRKSPFTRKEKGSQ